jgi:hypothetical protein
MKGFCFNVQQQRPFLAKRTEIFQLGDLNSQLHSQHGEMLYCTVIYNPVHRRFRPYHANSLKQFNRSTCFRSALCATKQDPVHLDFPK